jgi:hypothetical protein
MSNKFCHSAPKAFAPVDGLDEYLQSRLSRSQRGLVERIKDVEDRSESLFRADVATLNDKFGTLKDEFKDWRDDSLMPLKDEVETLKAEVKRLQSLRKGFWTVKSKVYDRSLLIKVIKEKRAKGLFIPRGKPHSVWDKCPPLAERDDMYVYFQYWTDTE